MFLSGRGWLRKKNNVKSISELRLCAKKHSEQFINAVLAEVEILKSKL